MAVRWLTARTARIPFVEDRALTRATVPESMLPIVGRDGPAIGPDHALRIADVFACVRCLADTAASLPLHAYVRSPTVGRERFTGRLASLLERPAPGTTTANLTGTLVAHLNLHGDAFLAKYRDDRGTVVQLAPLSPTAVTVSLEAGEPVYTLMRASGVSRHGPADILHVRALSVDGLTGLSPIRQARQALGLSEALGTHAAGFARNAGRPGGVLNVKAPMAPHLTDEQVTAEYLSAANRFQAGFTAERAGQVMVVAADEVEYTQLALSMADAEFVAQRQLSTAEIARVFRVPPWMIGAPSGDAMTYSNVEGQAQAFVKFSLAPWLALIEQAITADPDLSPANVYAEFVLDGLLRADTKTRAEVYALALDPVSGWMTRAEVRRLENLPAEPNGAPRV